LPTSSSVTRSTSRNGYRCGKNRKMSRISKVFLSEVFITIVPFVFVRDAELLLERLDARDVAIEAFHVCDGLLPLALLARRQRRAIDAALRQRLADPAARQHDDIVGNFQMSADARGAANHTARPDAGAAGDADARGDRSVRTDAAVVCDLNLVV